MENGICRAELMDILFLREFRLDILIGIYEWERVMPQTVQFDIEIGLPNAQASVSDQIVDTIDYSKVAERIRNGLKDQHFSLVEAVAEHVAHLMLDEFGVPWVKVSIAKLGVMRDVKQVGIIIERGQKS